MSGHGNSPRRGADLPAGYDDADPYDDVNIDELPAWWRENIKEFRAYNMRPYRPPRLQDGTLLPEIIADCEADFGVTIRIRALGSAVDETWSIWVGGEQAGSITRYRDGDGATVYELDASSFKALVKEVSSCE